MTDETRDLTPPPFVPYIPGPPEPPQEYTLYTAPASAPPGPGWPEESLPPPSERRVWVFPAIVILAFILMGAAGVVVALVALTPEPIAPTVAATPTIAASTTGPTRPKPVDSIAVRACYQLEIAPDGSYGNPDEMEPIGALAATSADQVVSAAGKILVDQARIARAAKGAADEPTMVLYLMARAFDFSTACIKGGYFTRR